jgi:hypothetical protein
LHKISIKMQLQIMANRVDPPLNSRELVALMHTPGLRLGITFFTKSAK